MDTMSGGAWSTRTVGVTLMLTVGDMLTEIVQEFLIFMLLHSVATYRTFRVGGSSS